MWLKLAISGLGAYSQLHQYIGPDVINDRCNS